MLKEERQNFILKQINLYNRVHTTDLCTALSVSLDTVRRDLVELENEGKLVKVHGGAISKTFHYPFQQTTVYAEKEKREIAKKALRLIHDGMLIIAGGGTIMIELAKILPKDMTGTLFTISPLVALEAAQRSTVDVILLSGKLARNSYTCVGSAVTRQLSEIRADLCFLGANGISLQEGVTEMDWEVAQVKQQMVNSAKKTAVLTIAEKLGTVQSLSVCSLRGIDYLVTELPANAPKLEKYGKHVKII